jgi:hypothetical protein
VECDELHKSLAAADKVAGQLRWQHEKKLREINMQREKVLSREHECSRAIEAHKRQKTRLQDKEESFEDDKKKTDNTRLATMASLRLAREAVHNYQRLPFSIRLSIFTCPTLLFACLFYRSTHFSACSSQQLALRMAAMAASRSVANAKKRQANKNLRQQGIKLTKSLSANAKLKESLTTSEVVR